MIKIFYTFIFFLSCSYGQSNASHPMLWKIWGHGLKNPSYLFGTFHTRDPKLNIIHPSALTMLQKSQRLYTETPMTPKSNQKIMRYSKMKHPISLKKRLHPKTIKLLLKYLIKHKLPYTLRSLKPYKTWAISLMLTSTKKGSSLFFMDEKLVVYAKRRKIKRAGLESIKEQLSYFNRLSKKHQEQFLLQNIQQKNKLAYENALKSWYKKGSEKGFLAIQERFTPKNNKQQKLDKILLDGLLFKRNKRFARRIDILLQNNSKFSYFFAVGAGHMSGEKGLLAILRKYGYRVKKID